MKKEGLDFKKDSGFSVLHPVITLSLFLSVLCHWLICVVLFFLTKIKFNTRQLRGVMCRHGSRFKGVCKNFHLVYDHFVFHLVETFEAA